MAIQIPPLAFLALRYGAVAVAGFAAARYAKPGRFSDAVEGEMDSAPDGFDVRKAPGQLSMAGKFTKTLRAGRFGPGFRVEGTALARLKIRRLS